MDPLAKYDVMTDAEPEYAEGDTLATAGPILRMLMTRALPAAVAGAATGCGNNPTQPKEKEFRPLEYCDNGNLVKVIEPERCLDGLTCLVQDQRTGRKYMATNDYLYNANLCK
jgi:hypothetical protein